MITLFTTPKPFLGHSKIIQSNAIKSWRALSPEIQIFLFGDSAGAVDVARAVNATHVADVQSNERGTPYINDMFSKAEKMSKNGALCYINADIVLPTNFIETVSEVSQRFNRFLMVGSRWDLDWQSDIDFADDRSVDNFWRIARENSQRHGVSGMDYFVYTRGLWNSIPNLLAGRAGFDNWLIWRARRSFVPVIDASERTFAVHQNHDYSHHKEGRNGVFLGEEAKHNKQFLGSAAYQGLNILDATFKYSRKGIERKRESEDVARFRSRLSRVFPEFSVPIRVANKLLGFLHG